MQLITRPYNLLGLAGIFTFLLSFFLSSRTFDLHIQDTYYVLAATHLFITIALYLLLLWLLYWLTRKWLFSRVLTWMHIIATLLALAVIMKEGIFSLIQYASSYSLSKEMSYEDGATFDRQEGRNILFIIAGFLFFVGQFLFLTNVIGGFIKRRRNRQ